MELDVLALHIGSACLQTRETFQLSVPLPSLTCPYLFCSYTIMLLFLSYPCLCLCLPRLPLYLCGRYPLPPVPALSVWALQVVNDEMLHIGQLVQLYRAQSKMFLKRSFGFSHHYCWFYLTLEEEKLSPSRA